MPYDPNLDQQVESKTWESEGGRIVVSVYSYNQGPKKLQIARENQNREGEYRFAKLGRMTREEVENVIPLIQELVSALD